MLYVDDEPDVRLIVALSLQLRSDIETRAAASANEAIRILTEEKWIADLVLVDVMMPEISGPQMLAKLRETPETSKIPVAFVTARARKQDIDDYLAQGAVGIIVKPFDALTFAEQALALLEQTRA
jgi:Response regulators consisting of a CheY-like receiver domain and a winged-helix DNA-binding domain